MIDVKNFIDYLTGRFGDSIIYVEEFKTDLWFLDIDCFPKQSYKLTIEVSLNDIKISTTNKEPELDFSLHDHVFDNQDKARIFIETIIGKQGFIISHSKKQSYKIKFVKMLFIIVANLFLPFLLLMLIIILQFFMNGEGASSEVMYQKYKIIWISTYSAFAIAHILLLYRL
jgi:hypothetical protein